MASELPSNENKSMQRVGQAYAECFPPGVVNFISGRGRDTMPPLGFFDTAAVPVQSYL